MKKLPLILSALFLAITLARVAQFAEVELRAGLLGWVFSIALGVAVFASAYWTRITSTRKQALAALVLFVSIDAAFNLAHVWLSVDTSKWIIASGAILYGIFPTVAVALLGWLSGAISRLPPGVGERSISRIEQALARDIERRLFRNETPAKEPISAPVEIAETVQDNKQKTPIILYRCMECNKTFDNPRSFAGHMSGHARAEKLVAGGNGKSHDRI